jgi:hypothetical protein
MSSCIRKALLLLLLLVLDLDLSLDPTLKKKLPRPSSFPLSSGSTTTHPAIQAIQVSMRHSFFSRKTIRIAAPLSKRNQGPNLTMMVRIGRRGKNP